MRARERVVGRVGARAAALRQRRRESSTWNACTRKKHQSASQALPERCAAQTANAAPSTLTPKSASAGSRPE